MRWHVAFVVTLLLAGCGTTSGPSGPSSAASTPETETTRQPATPTASPTATQPANPWRKETLTVVINDSAAPERDFRSNVKQALTYWENRDSKHGDYEVDFELVERSAVDDPDVEVRFVDNLTVCGELRRVGEFAGCAPVIDADDYTSHALVRVVADVPNRPTTETVKHEFGHVLGLDHDDDPRELMSHSGQRGDEPDATTRENPWGDDVEITVGIDADAYENPDTVAEYTKEAIRYYNTHSEARPADVRFEYVADHWDADVIVTREQPPNYLGTTGLDDSGSVAYPAGDDRDGDDAIEVYTYAYLRTKGLSGRDYEYHVGHWLGVLVSTEGDDLPTRYR